MISIDSLERRIRLLENAFRSTVCSNKYNSHNIYRVPDSAFADVANPTLAEAEIWGNNNISENVRKTGANLWFGGSEGNPQYLWYYNINHNDDIVLTEITNPNMDGNLYTTNGTIPNGSNRTIINSTEGLKIVDQNYPDNEIRFLSDYDTDSKVGINFTNFEEGAEGYIGMVEEKMKITSEILSIENDNFNFENGNYFDKNSSKKGLKLQGFGESDNDDTAGTADYSTLVNTSLVPKKYVDDNAGAKKINDLSDGISDNSSVYIGKGAGSSDDLSSNNNVGLGIDSLNSNVSGGVNVAVGNNTLYSNTTGYKNVALGVNSLLSNTIGYSNIGIGFGSLYNNNSGGKNISIGDYSLFSNNGNNNIGIGYEALFTLNGSNNIGIGYHVGYNQVSGDYNILIGSELDADDSNGSFQLNIGNIIKGYIRHGQEYVKLLGGQFRDVTTVNTATYTLSENDYDLSVTYTSTGSCVITIPTAQNIKGRTIYIADDGDNAATNNIKIYNDGGLMFTIDEDGAAIQLRYNGVKWRLR